MRSMQTQAAAWRTPWGPIGFEELPWARDPDALALVPKSRRRRIASTYRAAVPCKIAERNANLSPERAAYVDEVTVALARFDAAQNTRGYNLPALLLRSESSASSQIENLTSSVRDVALAELSSKAPHNARLIAGNVAAMRAALDLSDELTTEGICRIHRVLIEPTGQSFGGQLRDEQVWVGGTPYSPHGALFVPPQASRVPEYLDDLVRYARRNDVDPIVKAALVPIIERVANALELAMSLGAYAIRVIDAVLDDWETRITERKGSSIRQLPAVLVEQPVVDAGYVATRLEITPRAANNLLKKACDYRIVQPLGDARRGVFYQASEIIDVLEDLASTPGIKRILATGRQAGDGPVAMATPTCTKMNSLGARR